MSHAGDQPPMPHLHNRIAAVMYHIDRYNPGGITKVAADVGLSKAAVSRFVRGLTNPTYERVERIIKALERQLGRELPIRELISETGEYPTKYVCELVGCRGCQPDWMFDESNNELPEYESARKGHWTGDVSEGKRLDGQLLPIEEIR